MIAGRHQPLHAQEIRPELGLQGRYGIRQPALIDGSARRKAEGECGVPVTVHIVRVPVCMVVIVMCRPMVVIMTVVMRLSVLCAVSEAQPGADVRWLAGGIERGQREDIPGCRLGRMGDARSGIQTVELRAQAGRIVTRRAIAHEVVLGDQQKIGHRDLPPGLFKPVERVRAVHRIDQRDDPVDREALQHPPCRHEGAQHRPGIGQPRRLDHDAAEHRADAPVRLVQQAQQRETHVAGHRAAQAAGGRGKGPVRGVVDQQAVDIGLAEFVHDHRRVAEARLRHQPVEQRALAGTEEPGKDGNRNAGHCFPIVEAQGCLWPQTLRASCATSLL